MNTPLNQGIAESDATLLDQGGAAATHSAVSVVGSDAQNALLACVEARLAEEVHRLVPPMLEFIKRAQAIGEEIPSSAQLCKVVALTQRQLVLNLAQFIQQGCFNRLFLDDGRVYLDELGLSLRDFFREIDLDGRKYLAIAQREGEAAYVFQVANTRIGECSHCGKVHWH